MPSYRRSVSQLDVIQNIEYVHSELVRKRAPYSFVSFMSAKSICHEFRARMRPLGALPKSTYQPVGGARRIERRRGKCGRD